MELIFSSRKFMKPVRQWSLFAGFSAVILVALAGTSRAADPYYINDAIVSYPGTAPYPPTIDATNFINDSSFTVNFTLQTLPIGLPLYETWDTVNYTNIGTLMANTGFQFDTQSTASGLHTRAGSFSNSGLVSCGSLNDLTDPFLGEFALLGYAQCVVNATNISNPGDVDVGEGGLIEFTGANLDLSRSTLTIEGSGANSSGTGAFGLNTNLWDPSLNLGATFAETPEFPIAPFFLALTNSTAYMDLRLVSSNLNVIRAVFIQDTSGSNVTESVYFGTAGQGFGNGSVTIQWAGSYLDPASGNTYSNYLYLNDDYVLGTTTNVLPILGVPINFTFTASQTPLAFLGLPTAPGFLPLYPPGGITNVYDVANVQLSSGVSTNTVANNSITNLPGRVQITGDSNLDLTLATITGQNYISIRSTNQFNGAGGALIQTPYADINLGVTNGFLTVSNVMGGVVPNWGGTVVAWNTRWLAVDTTGAFPVTNDFRVLIVSSQLTPTTSGAVQDLILHGTNSIVISDTFNVLRTFSADAQSLTLTTNPPGNGATALDGELNLGSANIFWQTATPNLQYLTNNGAIRMQNLAYFGHPFLTNITPAVAASGTLFENGTNVVKKDKVTIGTNQYMFVATLTNTVANQVLIVPASFDASLSNLIAAIDGITNSSVKYSTATRSNKMVVAGALMNHSFTVTALTNGTGGNLIATLFAPATGATNLSWQGHTNLFGGLNMATNVTSFLASSAFINNGVFMDQGTVIDSGDFESGDIFSNGVGPFTLQSLTTTLTNGILSAGGDVAITTSSLVTSNLALVATRSLTLTVTNELTDTGVTNNSFWWVGAGSVGSGLNLPIKPLSGDLLGTTITLYGPTNRVINNVWAGHDYGISNAGYTNNEAVGQLIFDVSTPTVPGHNAVLTFNAVGVSNALYVDSLILTNFATQGNATNHFNFPWLKINTNMVIYYAQALANGVSVAEEIDNQSRFGANGGRLRWVYTYAGYFSSTNYVYTNLDSSTFTNTVNEALAQSTTIDSDSDGLPNNIDPTPFFLPSELNVTVKVTNLPPQCVTVQWTTIPNATNYIYYATNMMSTNWLAFTNFNNWYYGNHVAVTNAAHVNYFRSPQVYINNSTLPDNSQQTNVWVHDVITNVPHFYKVVVDPWLNFME
jgi:hypothetical protein